MGLTDNFRTVSLGLLLCAQAALASFSDTGSCCSLTSKELSAMKGTSDSCPSSFSRVEFAEKCKPCAPGVCPGSFLDSRGEEGEGCKISFGADWPDSVANEDVDWRSCNKSRSPGLGSLPKSDSFLKTGSCCSLSEGELKGMRGTSDSCPSSFSRIAFVKKCKACAPGVCPGSFLTARGDLREGCKKSFGADWPDSVSNEDVDWRSCSKITFIPLPSARNSSKTPGSKSSEAPNASDKTKKNTDVSSKGNTTDESISGDESKKESSSGLSTEAKIGIGTGLASLVVTVIGVLIAWRQWRQGHRGETPKA